MKCLIVLLLCLVPVIGCQAPTDIDMDKQSAWMDAWSKLAEEQGLAFVGTATYDGRTGIFFGTSAGLDTGATASVTLLGNTMADSNK